MAQITNEVVYQLDIRLAYIEPPIWRRMVVPGQVTLFSLQMSLSSLSTSSSMPSALMIVSLL